MDDAGWACCCYVLVEDRSATEVAALPGGRLSEVARREQEADQEWAAWPAAGPATPGWTVVVDPHFEFGDALAAWSAGTRVVRLLVIEREGFSQATAWSGGEFRWDISYEDGRDRVPRVSGAFPFDPDVLGAGSQAPVNAVRAVTGWQPRASDSLLLADLIYPRPALAGVLGPPTIAG